ncbi:MAG: aldo/keto reductase [Nitrososphaerota archaeon]|jgi:aryl-alcohol dehydrogenase-like predicted oxidoreductase|nr:aldo/keto reductase [Nitrososphaerota archaeon]MDG6932219.1 aldo/keto reductase [Nitrososphaerota archaeon]MDG6935788.1 aldo/keto reductase [Nitrososphaerota archaeon]MDG6944106.1 aldo/keto reductase [Nitrososphaerota archaeon]
MQNFGSSGNGLVGISINQNKFAINVQGALCAIRESIESGSPILDLRQSWLYPEIASRVKSLLIEVKNRNVIISAQVTRIYPGFDEVIKQVETIRNRLGIRQLDILEVGTPSVLVNLRETLKAVERLYLDEIIGGFSLVEIKAKHIKLITELNLNAKLQYIKLGVSARRPLINPDILKQAVRLNVPIFSTAPLDGGRLTENHFNGRLFRRLNGKLYRALDQISKSRNISFAQISIAWLNSKGIISAPSTTSPNHAFEDISSKPLKLTEHEQKMIEESSS